jgi:hypothetical protein
MFSLRRLVTAATIAAALVFTATGVAASDGNGTMSNNNTTSAPPSPPAPASESGSTNNGAVAYRVRLWAYAASDAIESSRAALTTALASDFATALGIAASSITLNDVVLVGGTTQNITVVFVARGVSSDAAFLASAAEAPATWANATNALLTTVWNSLSDRRAVAASESGYYTSVYVTKIVRLPSADLPKTRYYQIVFAGKHLGHAYGRPDWASSVVKDLATAFGALEYFSTHFNVTSQTLGGSNHTALTVLFWVKPVMGVAVNSTTFFLSRGKANWLTRSAAAHKHATYEELGEVEPAAREAGALGAAADAELSVTSTSYAPGDEAYTPGGAAGGVAAGAAAVLATTALVLLSMAL